MKIDRNHRDLGKVLGAAGLVVLLAGTLGFRLWAGEREEASAAAGESAALPMHVLQAPEAQVPRSGSFPVEDLPERPTWRLEYRGVAVPEFQADLDLLAPFGDGEGNAALWLKDFAKLRGARFQELQRASKRFVRLSVAGREHDNLFAPDDPLLLEAEPWIDQATCSFYPEVWKLEAIATSIPNLLFVMQLGRSWIARGDLAQDPQAAREDYQRTVRLGRLLLQDDVTLIQNLIGIHLVKLGTTSLYRSARAEGDGALAAAAAITIADADSIRRRYAELVGRVRGVIESLESGWFGVRLDVDEEQVDELVALARRSNSRPMRLEGLIGLQAVRQFAGGDAAERAKSVLEELSLDEDEGVARTARWFLLNGLDEDELKGMFSLDG